jgi:protein ImuB
VPLDAATGRLREAAGDIDRVLTTLKRWGLRTLGDLAALPSPDLFERLGETAMRLQRLARGEDTRPLIPDRPEDPFVATLTLEWPIEALEPLSFVLTRLLDPLCARLERLASGAATLEIRLRLVTKETYVRTLSLPAPFRDPRVLRTLALLDLESHPPGAGIDAVTITIEPTRSQVVQRSLLARADPLPEQLSILLARVQALMGQGRVGAAALVDTHRPGAFEMRLFTGVIATGARVAVRNPDGAAATSPAAGSTRSSLDALRPTGPVLRRFRRPLPAVVRLVLGRPVQIRMPLSERDGGAITASAGPWRTSGHWWAQEGPSRQKGPWVRDEWDVTLAGGGVYRIYRDHEGERWFVDGEVD